MVLGTVRLCGAGRERPFIVVYIVGVWVGRLGGGLLCVLLSVSAHWTAFNSQFLTACSSSSSASSCSSAAGASCVPFTFSASSALFAAFFFLFFFFFDLDIVPAFTVSQSVLMAFDHTSETPRGLRSNTKAASSPTTLIDRICCCWCRHGDGIVIGPRL